MQSLWKSVSSGWVPGPFGVTLKQAEKVGHRAFWELRSLVARSLSSLKKKNPTRYLPLSQIPSSTIIFLSVLCSFISRCSSFTFFLCSLKIPTNLSEDISHEDWKEYVLFVSLEFAALKWKILGGL